MQVGIDVTYMYTNFGGCDLFGFGDIGTFKNGQISPLSIIYYSNVLWTVWIFALIECNINEVNALLWIKTPARLIIFRLLLLVRYKYRSVSAARTAESSPPENNTATRESLTTLTSCPIALPISVLEHTSLFSTASCKSSKSLTASGVDSVFARITTESEGT